jgi:hypothetical protein
MVAHPGEYVDVPAVYDGAADFVTNETYSNQIGFDKINAAVDRITTTADELDDADAFYVAPVRSNAGGTTVWTSIYGKYNSEGLDGTTDQDAFWSIAFNGADGNITEMLTAGKQYIITIELKGKDGDGSGNEDDPTKEVVEEFLNIELQAADWTVVYANKVIE